MTAAQQFCARCIAGLVRAIRARGRASRSPTLPLTISALAITAPAWAQSGLYDLGTLNGGRNPNPTNVFVSTATSVSADGRVVVGNAIDGAAGHEERAFRWTPSSGMESLGALNGGTSQANGVSADGSVVVGSTAASPQRLSGANAFRWTQTTGMTLLGALKEGLGSGAHGVSADGQVVVGTAGDGSFGAAFRWTQATGMVSLGKLNGGLTSSANGVSGDGNVIVGNAADGAVANATRAFRWTQSGGMASLGVLNGDESSHAMGVSADGSVVVGYSKTRGNLGRAFRWSQATGMIGLGSINGGYFSRAHGASSDGRVVVGASADGAAGNRDRAFRWTQAGGMQTVEDWLRSTGVTVAVNTSWAHGTNSDGSVVVGSLSNGHAFIARDSSGLITLADVRNSLSMASIGGGMALTAISTVLNGAHSRPLAYRVSTGENVFWAAGDWGSDDHDIRSGNMGLAEVSLGRNFGTAQLNVSLGKTWAKQGLELYGKAAARGDYLLIEALAPIFGNLWGTVGAYMHDGEADLRRGYMNAGLPDASAGKPSVKTYGMRARLDWEDVVTVVGAGLTAYVDLNYSNAKMAAFTETGGGFPARFNARSDTASDLRLGIDAMRPFADNMRLTGVLEATRRLKSATSSTVGQVIGLFGFDLIGPAVKHDWLRAGVGVEVPVADGSASLTLNATTNGAMPSAWLAASWRAVF